MTTPGLYFDLLLRHFVLPGLAYEAIPQNSSGLQKKKNELTWRKVFLLGKARSGWNQNLSFSGFLFDGDYGTSKGFTCWEPVDYVAGYKINN